MKAPQDIIIAPVVTERSMAGFADKKYTFKVAGDATKIDIARAVEQKFGVKVEKVNTVSVRGHKRRMGRYEGMTSSWKKAIVTLKKDSKTIEFFDGLM
jgi:large subunit ribosomal protein L23